MKSVRLLPVVIFAALALLLFKGIGLVTNGGYVLTGTDAVLAAGGSTGETAAEGGLPGEVTLADTSPTLDDTAPTLATKAVTSSSGHGEASEEAHGSSQSEASSASASSSSGEASSTEAPPELAQLACPPAKDAGHGDATAVECPPAVTGPVNEHGDALPLVKDADGNVVPLTAQGDGSEEALVARLSERRGELDRREADLTMRTALLEAAEKRLDERTQELAALEARVAALVDEKQAAEQAGFKAVVSMYEGMKPKDAAKIFDTLSLNVLLKVARAMSPRKMSPILAAMSPDPAQKLTTAMAATENTDVVVATGENLTKLPQIVGQ